MLGATVLVIRFLATRRPPVTVNTMPSSLSCFADALASFALTMTPQEADAVIESGLANDAVMAGIAKLPSLLPSTRTALLAAGPTVRVEFLRRFDLSDEEKVFLARDPDMLAAVLSAPQQISNDLVSAVVEENWRDGATVKTVLKAISDCKVPAYQPPRTAGLIVAGLLLRGGVADYPDVVDEIMGWMGQEAFEVILETLEPLPVVADPDWGATSLSLVSSLGIISYCPEPEAVLRARVLGELARLHSKSKDNTMQAAILNSFAGIVSESLSDEPLEIARSSAALLGPTFEASLRRTDSPGPPVPVIQNVMRSLVLRQEPDYKDALSSHYSSFPLASLGRVCAEAWKEDPSLSSLSDSAISCLGEVIDAGLERSSPQVATQVVEAFVNRGQVFHDTVKFIVQGLAAAGAQWPENFREYVASSAPDGCLYTVTDPDSVRAVPLRLLVGSGYSRTQWSSAASRVFLSEALKLRADGHNPLSINAGLSTVLASMPDALAGDVGQLALELVGKAQRKDAPRRGKAPASRASSKTSSKQAAAPTART